MQALARLMDAGVEGAMVAAGGDIACAGRPAPDRPWSFGIQNPFDRDSVLAVVDPPGAVATSGTYERGEHIVDPRSGTRASAVASASVIGPDLDLADALATALVAGGAEALAGVTAAADGYEALMVNPDGTLLASPGFLLRPG
jgi:thiamine biosynthesis lipoprotein